MTETQTVGGYFRLISALGGGGFGETFLAEDTRNAAYPRCVVKQLKPQSADTEFVKLSKRLFEQEVRILYQIGAHPQIPSIITHFEEANEFYFVQEYVEGNTFEELIAKGEIYSSRKVVEIITELLSVLAFVHSRGVIHRDVKPANLICRASDGKTVLIDFGAVKQVNIQQQTEQHTIAIGSQGFMPPEQLAGQPRFASDVYAVGMLAVQLLTQTHPTELRQSQRTGEWIWQDKVTVNNQFAEFISRMIRYDFRQRFTDAVAALNYLRNMSLVNNENAVCNTQENFQNKFDKRQTQATFFSPIAISSQNANSLPETTLPRNVPPNYQQPYNHQINLQPINTERFVYSIPEQTVINKSSVSDSVSLGGLAFDGFAESKALRPLIYSLVFIASLTLIIISMAKIEVYNNSQNTVQQIPLPVFTPQTKSPSIKPDTKGFMTSAQYKERKATKDGDWFGVAQEWQKAEAFYTKAESLAVTDEDREAARKDKDYCIERKLYALSKSEPKKQKNRL